MFKSGNDSDFLTIDEIRTLLKSRLSISVSRAAIYGYIKKKEFPPNLGIGTPRIWRRKDVCDWIERYETPSVPV